MIKALCGIKNLLMRRLSWKTALGIFALGLVSFSFLWLYYMFRLPPCFYLGEKNIGYYTFSALDEHLDHLDYRMKKEKAVLVINEKGAEKEIILRDLGIEIDREQTIKNLKKQNVSIPFLQRITGCLSPTQIQVSYRSKNDCFETVFVDIAAVLHQTPGNAEVRAEQGQLIFTPHKNGLELAIEPLKEELKKKLSIWPGESLVLKAEMLPVYPEHTVFDVINKGVKEEVALKQTQFNPSNENRAHNIKLAASKINNILLAPGELFSFNQYVGKASLEGGFKNAPVIIDDQLVPEAGGGICQVSSTLYNAALYAGLEIKERHNHGLAVNYLPPGFDAAVAYDYLDLKFINNYPCHLLIHLYAVDGYLKAKLFGTRDDSLDIRIIARIKKEISYPIQEIISREQDPGYRAVQQTGRPGYQVETYRQYYQNGKEVGREHLYSDSYAPRPEIVVIGPSS